MSLQASWPFQPSAAIPAFAIPPPSNHERSLPSSSSVPIRPFDVQEAPRASAFACVRVHRFVLHHVQPTRSEAFQGRFRPRFFAPRRRQEVPASVPRSNAPRGGRKARCDAHLCARWTTTNSRDSNPPPGPWTGPRTLGLDGPGSIPRSLASRSRGSGAGGGIDGSRRGGEEAVLEMVVVEDTSQRR